MPTVQIIRFPADDPLLFRHASNITIKMKGVISAYYGLQTEGGHIGYIVVIWEIYEPALWTARQLGIPGPLDIQHVHFDKHPTTILESPTTEFAFLTLKLDKPLDLADMAKTLCDNLIKEDTCHDLAWGEIKEHEGSWVMAIGWDSMQAHLDAVSQGVFPELIKSMHILAEIDIKHVNLVKYTQ